MKKRFGIIGCGVIAARFADALNHSESGQLYAVAARDPERAAVFAQKNGAEKSYGSYQEMLADPNVDCVYIATVNSTHAGNALLCIEAGKPVICEKPFFINTKEAEEVIAAARKAKVLIMEAMWSRCLPVYHQVKKWVKEGRIGDVRLIRSAFCFPMPYNEETAGNRLFDPDTGGGACLDVGVYPYEYATGIMEGPPDECKLIKVMGPTGVDLSTGLFLKYNSGVIVDCLSSICGIMNEDAVIGGSDGYIVQKIFYGSHRGELYDLENNLLDSIDDPVENGFVHEVEHFCDMLDQGALESTNIPLADTVDFTRVYEQLLREE